MGENMDKEQLRDPFGIFLNLLFSLPLQKTIWYKNMAVLEECMTYVKPLQK